MNTFPTFMVHQLIMTIMTKNTFYQDIWDSRTKVQVSIICEIRVSFIQIIRITINYSNKFVTTLIYLPVSSSDKIMRRKIRFHPWRKILESVIFVVSISSIIN